MTPNAGSGSSARRLPSRRGVRWIAAAALATSAAVGAMTTPWSVAAAPATGGPETKPATRRTYKKPTPATRTSVDDSSPVASNPATAPAYVPTERDLATIAEMERYYAKIYSRPLEIESNARLAHLIAVGSLARIDAAATADKLLVIAERGKADHRVAQVAWEALAVRHASLTADQRNAWLDAGLAIADAGGFPGDTAAPLLAALATRPPPSASPPKDASADPKDAKAAAKTAKLAKSLDALLLRVAEENDPATEYGKRTLSAAAAALAAWGDKDVVGRLVRQMGRSTPLSRRIDLMLRQLPDAPPEPGDKSAAVAAAWTRWLPSAMLAPPAGTQPAYAGDTHFYARPERIINPRDPKWSAEIEMPRLQVAEVNVAFCVDATGSMAESNEYVTAYLEMAVKGLSIVSPSIKAGAVYYRHENVKEFMVDCCKKAATDRTNFLVRGMPLTADVPGLVRQMRAQKVEGSAGHDAGGGAYLTALNSAAEMLGPPRKDVARVAVIVGDTFVTHGTEKVIVEAAKKAGETGLIVVFVVRDDRAAASVKAASLAASGLEAIVYRPDLAKFKQPGVDPAEGFVATAFGKATERSIAAMVSKAYADRVPPLLKNVWRIFLAEMRGEKAKAALK